MKLAILAAALVLAGAKPAPAPEADAPPPVPAEGFDRMNLHREQPGCVPIARQVAELGRGGNRAQRLDRLPPGHAFLAVDRRVNGCREVTLLRDERRRRR